MGEAVYYAKARFPSPVAAEAALERLEAFIVEGNKAADWWQQHRSGRKSRFWPRFKDKFPEVSKYLDHVGLLGGDCNNALAGHLDFGDGDSEPMLGTPDTIVYSAMVWHLADWGAFLAWIERELGAVRTAWISDESMDPFDVLDVSKTHNCEWRGRAETYLASRSQWVTSDSLARAELETVTNHLASLAIVGRTMYAADVNAAQERIAAAWRVLNRSTK